MSSRVGDAGCVRTNEVIRTSFAPVLKPTIEVGPDPFQLLFSGPVRYNYYENRICAARRSKPAPLAAAVCPSAISGGGSVSGRHERVPPAGGTRSCLPEDR